MRPRIEVTIEPAEEVSISRVEGDRKVTLTYPDTFNIEPSQRRSDEQVVLSYPDSFDVKVSCTEGDPVAVYFGNLLKGDKGDPGESGEKPSYYYSGLAVMLNGVDVSHNPQAQSTCISKWYGSASAYANLVRDGLVRSGVAYYLAPNPDWDETNEESLSFIMHKPTILDAKMNENHTMKLDFYYK